MSHIAPVDTTPRDEDAPWVKQLRRQTRLALIVGVAALVAGPIAGYSTAQVLNQPGPQGETGQRGAVGPPGPQGPAGQPITPEALKLLMADAVFDIRRDLNAVASQANDSCQFPVTVVSDVSLSESLGELRVDTQTQQVCPWTP